jgi:adenosine deaminase CECR1
MVGKKSMGLYGWKQLVMWSLEHACLDDEEREEIMESWKILWREFLIKVIDWDRKRGGDSAYAVEEKSKM